MTSDIEYFYAAHSAFAYLGSARLQALAAGAGRRIAHRPMDLDRVIAACGAPAFAVRSEAHVRYYFGREIDRWSEVRDAPVLGRIPTHHGHDPAFANRVILAGVLAGLNVDALSHAMLEAHWRDDLDLADREALARVVANAGYDAAALLERAAAPEAEAALASNTAEAIERSVFGSPTYFVDGDMFYGQDRLELVARALERPFGRG